MYTDNTWWIVRVYGRTENTLVVRVIDLLMIEKDRKRGRYTEEKPTGRRRREIARSTHTHTPVALRGEEEPRCCSPTRSCATRKTPRDDGR